MAERIRYEVDPYNRLVAIDGGLALPKQRQIIDGVFAIGESGCLQYRVKSPSDNSENIPYQVKLQGTWSLTKDHNLKFTIDKSAGGLSGDSLVISGDIMDIRGDAILFSVTTKRGEDLFTTYVLDIAGVWQADENNRLSFKVTRAGDRYDTLLFEAGWGVGKNNEIVYRYETRHLKRKEKISHTLTLNGKWNIGQKSVLIYQIEGGSPAGLNFKASLGICGDDYIKYELGIKLSSRQRPVSRIITLFGTWRIGRGSGLSFDVNYGDGRIYSIVFTAEARLTSVDTISFKLKDDINKKDIGITVELNHAILEGDGSAFIRFLRSHEESIVMVGAGINW